ncbi:MAG: hypothetical protein LBS65_05460 [Desulfovibrio sp.]|nr:hypothetical protein [Desulfovibrio sp.]
MDLKAGMANRKGSLDQEGSIGLQAHASCALAGFGPRQASVRTDTPPFRAGSGYPA